VRGNGAAQPKPVGDLLRGERAVCACVASNQVADRICNGLDERQWDTDRQRNAEGVTKSR
jgi:hypothetical protein